MKFNLVYTNLKWGLVPLLCALSACGNAGTGFKPSLTPEAAAPIDVLPAVGGEFVSASGQSASTADGKYIVSSSLGDSASFVQAKTGSGNYIYEFNVQGQILSQ